MKFLSVRKIRMISGTILFAYVTGHLINHAFGLISIDAMQAANEILHSIWANPVGLPVLYLSIFVHILFGLWALVQRQNWRLRVSDAIQIVLALAIPWLLALHVIGTRGAEQLAGTEVDYYYVLAAQWSSSPWMPLQQTAGVLASWFHGCLGIYYWLRLKPWFRSYIYWAFAIAIIVPTLSLAGYYVGGQESLLYLEDQDWIDYQYIENNWPQGEKLQLLLSIRDWTFNVLLGLVGLIIAWQAGRWIWNRRVAQIAVTYQDGSHIRFPKGMTLLEASQANGIAHTSVCGGRGRCSTCRVAVRFGSENLPPASAEEQAVLDRISASPDVRLACQSIPTKGPLTIAPLLPARAALRKATSTSKFEFGNEKEIAVLFADIRGFTSISEKKLPYDVVFILNRYFEAVGKAIESSGGHLDKFIGDGTMALFGLNGDLKTGCHDALKAARKMIEAVEALNLGLEQDLGQGLRIGIGIHAGPAIVGEMGYGSATQLTAVGDIVNTASRLESATKEHKALLIASELVVSSAAVNPSIGELKQLSVRGREGGLPAFVVMDINGLPS